MAKSLFDGHIFDIHFTPYLYKKLLGRSLTLRDVEAVDSTFYASLKWIEENDVVEADCGLFFCTEETAFGATKVIELVEGGQAMAVDNENKMQHRGFGKKLMEEAEEIAKKHGKNKMLVIAGVGTKEYYKKLGYDYNGPYMGKKI